MLDLVENPEDRFFASQVIYFDINHSDRFSNGLISARAIFYKNTKSSFKYLFVNFSFRLSFLTCGGEINRGLNGLIAHFGDCSMLNNGFRFNFATDENIYHTQVVTVYITLSDTQKLNTR